MNPDDTLPLEGSFADHLIAYDEALTEGRANVPLAKSSLSPEMHTRLQRARACLQPSKVHSPRLAEGLSQPRQAEGYGARLGRFEVRREIGRGGFGIVFLAWDSEQRREVALKIPRLEVFLTPQLCRRFFREACAAARLDHPGIVPVYEAGKIGTVYYLVTAYCPGRDLAHWLSERTAPVPPRQAATLIASVAEAVQYIHERHIWHRDIKPSNILLQPRQRSADDGLPFTPRLTDFGLAKLLQVEIEPTPNGAILGTSAYMAPEQAAGRLDDIGPHTDIYALGAVLHELLSGQPPIRPMPRNEPAQLRFDVPRDLETICLKCLQEAPCSRYASARELAADLRHFLNGETIVFCPPAAPARAALAGAAGGQSVPRTILAWFLRNSCWTLRPKRWCWYWTT